MLEMGKAYKLLFGKPEGKRPLGRPKHRWKNEHSIKVELNELGLLGRVLF
jgi:hypothetical protein